MNDCEYCNGSGWFYSNRDLGACGCRDDFPEPTLTIGPHRLYMGDAYVIRPLIGRCDVDVLDPQYEFNNSGGGKWRRERNDGANEIVRRGLDDGFNYGIIDPELCGGAVVFCHDNSVPTLGAYLRERFHRAVLLQWIKPNPSPMFNKNYLADNEFYWHAWHKGSHPVGTHADMCRQITAASVPSKRYNHPTVKPDAVMGKVMRNVNAETVCDPFMGTGSTGVAAIRAGKTFIGIERDEATFAMAAARLYDAFTVATGSGS